MIASPDQTPKCPQPQLLGNPNSNKMPQNELREQNPTDTQSRRNAALWTTSQPGTGLTEASVQMLKASPEVTGYKKIKRLLFILAFFKLVKA